MPAATFPDTNPFRMYGADGTGGWSAVMSMVKISAGTGYKYLTQHTAAHDAERLPPGGLAGYYAERGEAPGMWVGSGLAGLGMSPGDLVSEAQMTALFAHGHHPNQPVALGTPFPDPPAASPLLRGVAEYLRERNVALGLPACAEVSKSERAAARTAVARELFATEHGRAPTDARELSSFIAAQSRLAPDTVAGYDLTFSPVKSVSAWWALAPKEIAAQIEAAHKAAVGDTMSWLERHATFT
ncbi:MAG TPA: relaxase domain-containing protein, partial [Casimicrobiaceae bacterium]